MSQQAAAQSLSTPHRAGLNTAAPLAVAAFTVFLLFGQADIAFTGPGSMQLRLLAISALGCPVAYLLGAIRWRSVAEPDPSAGSLRLGARTLAVTLGLVMLVILLVPVLAQAFVGYTFPWFWGAVTAAAYGLVAGYVCGALGARQWVGDIVLLAVLVALVGVLAAAMLSGADQWWTTAISALGTSFSMSWRIFDVVCIAAGLMVLLASTSVGPAIEVAVDQGVATPATKKWFPGIMATVAILLCFVGLFPMDGNKIEFLLHNIGGIGFGVTLFVAMALTWRAFPGLPREFIWYSWAFAALTALATLAFRPLAIFSLAELEVVAFGFEVLWAILLFASLRDASRIASGSNS